MDGNNFRVVVLIRVIRIVPLSAIDQTHYATGSPDPSPPGFAGERMRLIIGRSVPFSLVRYIFLGMLGSRSKPVWTLAFLDSLR